LRLENIASILAHCPARHDDDRLSPELAPFELPLSFTLDLRVSIGF
jgi:hypothetical protein